MKKIKSPNNNNIGRDYVVLIMPPAKNKITSKQMLEVVLLESESSKAEYNLDDYASHPMWETPAHIFKFAFGPISRDEFYTKMFELYSLSPGDKVGVYFFQRSSLGHS